MAGKYEKYILTDLVVPDDVAARMDEYNQRATRILWLEDFIIKGAPSIITSWYWKATDEEGTPSHTHDFDEVVGFFGSDTDNPSDLCGEVEFWLEELSDILSRRSSALPSPGCQSRQTDILPGGISDQQVRERQYCQGSW